MASIVVLPVYARLVRPATSNRHSLWNYFGFPGNESGIVVTRSCVVCTQCERALSFTTGSDDNLRKHLDDEHPHIVHAISSASANRNMTTVRPNMNNSNNSGRQVPGERASRVQKRLSEPSIVYESDTDGDPAHSDEYYAEESDADAIAVGEPEMIEYLVTDGEQLDDDIALEEELLQPADNETELPSIEHTTTVKRRKISTIEETTDDVDSTVHKLRKTDPTPAAAIPTPSTHAKHTSPPVQQPALSHNLRRMLAEVCAGDLLPPQLFGGPAFARFLRDFSGATSAPTTSEVCDELRSMQSELLSAAADAPAEPFALIIERWSNVEGDEFYTLGIAYDAAVRRSLCTWPAKQLAPATPPWSDVLCTVDMRKCQAVVVNFARSCDDVDDTSNTMPAFVTNRTVPIVRCMADVIEMAAGKALRLVPDEWAAAFGAQRGLSPDSGHSKWLGEIDHMDEWCRQRRDVHDGADDNPATTMAANLERCVECLQPLKIALDTLRLEERASASLCRPLAQQLVANHFGETSDGDDDDSVDIVLAQMKATVRETLEKHIMTNDFLPAVSYLDPRFHTLTDDAQLPDIRTAIRAMCPIPTTTVVVKDDSNKHPPTNTTTPTTTTTKRTAPTKPGLSFFFAAQSTAAARNAKPRPPPPPPLDVELQQYATSVDALPLDHNPREWWSQQAFAYPLLSSAAGRLWCVPAMIPTIGESELQRRRWLRSVDDVSALLAVHEQRVAVEKRDVT